MPVQDSEMFVHMKLGIQENNKNGITYLKYKLRFMNHYQETFNTWDKVAQLYAEKFMDLTIYNHTYDFLLNQLKVENATLLELGCGPGNVSKYLKKQNKLLSITGIDVSPNMIQIAKQNLPTSNFEVMDVREVGKLNGQFNAIVCGFVIPYLNKKDCKKLFNDCLNLLESNGLFYLSFVHGNPSKSGFISGSNGNRTFFYYFDKEEVEKSLIDLGFKLLEQFDITYNKSANHNETHTVLVLAKN